MLSLIPSSTGGGVGQAVRIAFLSFLRWERKSDVFIIFQNIHLYKIVEHCKIKTNWPRYVMWGVNQEDIYVVRSFQMSKLIQQSYMCKILYSKLQQSTVQYKIVEYCKIKTNWPRYAMWGVNQEDIYVVRSFQMSN